MQTGSTRDNGDTVLNEGSFFAGYINIPRQWVCVKPWRMGCKRALVQSSMHGRHCKVHEDPRGVEA